MRLQYDCISWLPCPPAGTRGPGRRTQPETMGDLRSRVSPEGEPGSPDGDMDDGCSMQVDLSVRVLVEVAFCHDVRAHVCERW